MPKCSLGSGSPDGMTSNPQNRTVPAVEVVGRSLQVGGFLLNTRVASFVRARVRANGRPMTAERLRFATKQEQSFNVSDRYARARNNAGPATVAAFQVRGRFLTALALRIDTERADGPFYAQLDEQLGKSPQLFLGAPIVLDLLNTRGFGDSARMRDLVDNLRARDLQVFGVQNAAGIDAAVLQGLGLIALASGRDAPLPRDAGPAPVADAPPKVENKVIRSTIRSGQIVVAEQGDLTVIGSVASGAELVAAGNIHVYGTLRGRAMAGCHGDMGAHIFCQSLSAELVAIAGIYETSETLGNATRQKCTHIYLEAEKLCMEVIA